MSIVADGLVKSYRRRRVVDGVSFEVYPGEIVGLLGPNGAGKTTSFYMVVGLIKADSGRVFLSEDEITDLPMHLRARRGVGYLSQEASVFRGLTVEENLLAILEANSTPGNERRDKAMELMKKFNIDHLKNQKGNSLSGGERRRVEIVRALATEPSYLLLDEPFSGVDPIGVSDVQSMLEHLREEGFGILLTDHSVRDTLSITSRAYIIHQGKILISGSSEEIATSEVARKIYLGERFRM